MSSASGQKILKCSKCGAANRIDASRESVAVCGRCKNALVAHSAPVILTDRNFSELVEKSPLPVLVDFWAAWCGPCRMVAPVMEELARELSGRVLVGKLDVDANQETAARFWIQSIPSILIFQHGREVDRIMGAVPKAAIVSRLQPFLKS